MRWLIITDILMRCTNTINMIFHQRTNTILRFKICGKNTKFTIIIGRINHFFPPVSPNITIKTWICFSIIYSCYTKICSTGK